MSIEIKLRKVNPWIVRSAVSRKLWTVKELFAMYGPSYFEKPSDKKRQARKVAAFTQMLRTRYEKM